MIAECAPLPPARTSFVDFLASGPGLDDLDLDRDRSLPCGLVIATRDVGDFAGSGVDLLDPWTDTLPR